MSLRVSEANKANLLASYVRQLFIPKIQELTVKAGDELRKFLIESDENLADHYKSLVGDDYKVLRPVHFAEIGMKGLNMEGRYDVKLNGLKNPVLTFPSRVCVRFTDYEVITIKGDSRLKVDYIPSEMPSLGEIVSTLKAAQDLTNWMAEELEDIATLRGLSDYFDSKIGEAA